MQLILKSSSIVEVLEDLQSAVDNGLNNGGFMLRNYRLKYRVDKQSKVAEFMVYRPMMREYRIKGEISKIADNSYNITASISQVELAFTLIIGVFMAIILTGIIFRGEYIMGVPMFIALPTIFLLNYKYTEGKIKKIFKQLGLNSSGNSSAECKNCDFENFPETVYGKWTYFKKPELIKRTQNMIIMDFIAVVCILVGFLSFFHFVPILAHIMKSGMPGADERVKLFTSIGIFLLCAFFVILSLFSGPKRK